MAQGFGSGLILTVFVSNLSGHFGSEPDPEPDPWFSSRRDAYPDPSVMKIPKLTTTFGPKTTPFCFCFHLMQKPSKRVKTQ